MAVLKGLNCSISLISAGKEFHIRGPATLKERSANVDFLVKGTLKIKWALLDLVFRWDLLMSIKSIRYLGAQLCKHLCIKHRTLKSIRSRIGSQCNVFSASVELSNLERRRTTLAAQFWMRCNFLMLLSGKPVKIQFAKSRCDSTNDVARSFAVSMWM